MYKEKVKIKYWYVLLVALIQFPLKLTGNLFYLSYLFVYGVPFVYLLLNVRILFKIYKAASRIVDLQIFKLVYGYLLIFSVIWPIISGTFDFSYITLLWRSLFLWMLKYTFLLVVYKKNVNRNGDFEGFAVYFIKGVSLYTIVSLMALFILPIRNFMFRIIHLSENEITILQRGDSQTRFGWTGWSGFNETMVCTAAVVFVCILLIKNNCDRKKQIYLSRLMLFPLIGNALFGRIGLLASVACICLTYCFIFLKGNISYILRIFLFVVLAFVLFIILKEKIEILNNWYNWVFSAFENYLKKGKFYDSTGSIEHLTTDMYWMPEIGTFLFGDGYYTGMDGKYYMHTDSGIMRPMLFYGIINYVFSVLAVILLAKRFSVTVLNKKHKDNKLIVIIIILYIAIFEFKGESLWMFIGIVLPIVLVLNNQIFDMCIKQQVEE